MTFLNNLCFFLIGFTLGMGAYRFFLHRPRETQKLAKQLNEHQAQFNQYQAEVDDHFKKTAELFSQFSRGYQEMHQHLASGAQSLSHHPMPSEITLDLEPTDALAQQCQEHLQPPQSTPSQLNDQRPKES